MESVVGWQGEWDADPRSVFLHPALWREQVPQEFPAAPHRDSGSGIGIEGRPERGES
jgi:hypothetical protein